MRRSPGPAGGQGPRRRFVALVEISATGAPVLSELLRPLRHSLPVGADGAAAVATGDVVVGEEPVAAGGPCSMVGRPLARAGSIRSELYRLAAGFGLDPCYPPAVVEEAAAMAARPGIDDPALTDLSDVPFVTIDDARARDLDQAVHVAATPSGWVVRYALADAAHFVRPASALMAEALERGASFYLPGLTLPMLPRVLSEGVVSLNPGVNRRALVLAMTLDREGRCRATEVARARVRSVAKLSFQRVQRYFDDPAGSPLATAPWRASLDGLRAVGEMLEAAARRRHVVRYHRRESEIRLGEGERAGFVVVGDERGPVERYNEQISLLANVEGGRLLAAAAAGASQAVFRVHPAPPAERLAQLADRIDALVAARRLDPGRWRWRRPGEEGVPAEPLADYLARLPRRGRGAGAARAVERQGMLLNERASFVAAPGPHAGIGAPVYARFSAPMREVVGIVTHKEALELLGLAAPGDPETDEALRQRAMAAGNRAKEVQRQLTKAANRLVLDRIFRAELGLPTGARPRHAGTVLGVEESRLYVQLERPLFEVKVYRVDLEEQLGRDLRVDEHDVMLKDRATGEAVVTLGDRVALQVAGFDAARDRWVLRLG